MITLDDLNAAIKECEGQRNPDANTALKLAAFYTIKKELFPSGNVDPPSFAYSFAEPPNNGDGIKYESGTDFGAAVRGKEPAPVMAILDELMTVLHSAQPRLHRRIIDELSAL